jgi:hypothetical protein
VKEKDIYQLKHQKYMKTITTIAILLLFSTLLVTQALATSAVNVSVKNRYDYINPKIGSSTPYVAFYYVIGDKIEWWQGGTSFSFRPGTPEYEKVTQFFIALPEVLGIKVEKGSLYLVIATAHAEYIFSGIVRFRDYLFIDDLGKITVDYVYGDELNVTFNSKVTVNASASKIDSFGLADWQVSTPFPNVKQWSKPTIQVPTGKEVLAVPIEGYKWDEEHNAWIGGAPISERVNGEWGREISLAGTSWWKRDPQYLLVITPEGVETYKYIYYFNEVWLA